MSAAQAPGMAQQGGQPAKQQQPYVKQEQAEDKEMLDDDIYEDAGDLDFSQAMQDVWLTRLPKSLWQTFAKLDDDEEIHVGTLRVEGPPNDIKRISLRVNDGIRGQDVPRDYCLRRQNIRPDKSSFAVPNTYVFSEKDLPGHVDKANILFNEAQTNGRSFLYEQMKRDARKKGKPKKWTGPYVRKTIPKSTAIVGKVHDEFNCLPVQNEEYERIAEARALEVLKPRKETIFLEKVSADMRNPKTAIAADKSTFIQTTKTAKPKSHDTKTMRIPQNELLDLIYACFRRYRYWPFKALKAELKQPEAYLKQTLEMVAHLVRSGNFAMTWELKPEARESNYAEIMAANQGEHGQLAPSSGFDDGGETAGEAGPEEDEDGDVKFENVM